MEIIIKENEREGKLFIDKNLLDNETMKQIRSMIRNETVNNARIMPDCHKGNGCCIGFTSKLIDKIVPNFVGGDIGCGIVSYPLELAKDIKVKKLDTHIKNTIPLGSLINMLELEDIDRYMDRIYKLSNEEGDNFVKYYNEKFNIDISKYKPEYNSVWFNLLCDKINTNKSYDLKSLGTLGGGNHFIEVNKSDITDKEYITVHSGSRNLGQKICKYHQSIIIKGREIDWTFFDDKVKNFSRNCKDKKEIGLYKKKLRDELMNKRHPEYLIDDEAFNYYFDMIFAQKYALVNREIIIERIIEYYNLEFDPNKKIESIHNYIDFNDFIIRKGAISAYEDKLCLIALNMRDGILLCKGKSNNEWNNSSAHGAGRILTRQKACKNKKSIVKRLQKDLNKGNVFSTNELINIVDESPECYRDSELIKTLIDPSVEIIEQLKPILNIKGF